jgi:hypothetical protein
MERLSGDWVFTLVKTPGRPVFVTGAVRTAASRTTSSVFEGKRSETVISLPGTVGLFD